MHGPHDDDSQIVRAIGEELRRARQGLGWSRPELIKRMNVDMPVNTYACYEQGIRQCSIPRLVHICRTLGVAAPELLELALRRVEIDPHIDGVRVDLHKILGDHQDRLRPLRQWARNRLNAEPNGHGVVRLEWGLVEELAIFFDLVDVDLVDYLKAFAPDAAPGT